MLLRLGRFDGAVGELNLAVTLSSANEAPRHEEARYLARRATLHRHRGAFVCAANDFTGALAVLEAMAHLSLLDRAFEQAKVMDEQALYHLAVGCFDEAIGALQHSLDTFERYQAEHRLSATFRLLRSRLRLALAYWCRGEGQPPRLLRALEPLPDTPDARHARTLLAPVEANWQLKAADPCLQPLTALFWEISSLLAATPEAAALSQEGLTLARHPYQSATAQTMLATALLRGGRQYEAAQALSKATSALAAAAEQPGGQGDGGLLAWLSALELRLALAGSQFKMAVDILLASLEPGPLSPYHEALIRVFGEAVELLPNSERLTNEQLARLLPLPVSPGSLRLPDELVLRWRQRRRVTRPPLWGSTPLLRALPVLASARP